jgi:inhibitor of apoptosis-promoting Bax1
MFGALALCGSITRRSLAGAGQFFFMGLIGLVLVSIVGIFWHSAALQFLISVLGVIVLTGAHNLGRPAAEADGARSARVGSSAPMPSWARYPSISTS